MRSDVVQILQGILRRAQAGARAGESTFPAWNFHLIARLANHPRVSRVSAGFPRLQRWPRAAEMSMASVVCRNVIEIPRGLSTPKRGRPITAFIEIVLSNSSRDSAPLPYSPVQRVSRFPPRSLARDNERAEDTRHGPSSTKTRTRLPPVRLPAERETNDRFCPCECALLSLSLSRKTRFFFLC